MKQVFKWMALALSVCLMLALAACGPSQSSTGPSSDPAGVQSETADKTPDDKTPEGNTDTQDKKVSTIEVQAKPTKSEYVVGDEFTVEGGTILVTYSDQTTETVPMSDSRVTVTPPGLSASGTKQVKVEFGGQSCRFTVQVAGKSFAVTFDQNYEGAPEAAVENVNKGNKAAANTPERAGYTFQGWYVDTDYTAAFDFNSIVESDMTLYALWTQDGAEYHTVTFDYDFYGGKIAQYSYPVISGGTVAEPAAQPERVGYQFSGWTAEDGSAFDFTAAVSGDVKVVASWTKTQTGVQEYIFEAEDTDLTGKTGPALSGDAMETGMIVQIAGKNASGDRCVSYLYQNGVSLEFDFASDAAVSDATIWLSLSGEYRDYVFNPGNFSVYLNDAELNYSDITFTGVPAPDDNKVDCLDFEYYLMGSNVTLKEGANRLQVVVQNSDPMQGTTLKAAAPMVDALKISTSAVLTWDASKDLPRDNY